MRTDKQDNPELYHGDWDFSHENLSSWVNPELTCLDDMWDFGKEIRYCRTIIRDANQARMEKNIPFIGCDWLHYFRNFTVRACITHYNDITQPYMPSKEYRVLVSDARSLFMANLYDTYEEAIADWNALDMPTIADLERMGFKHE